MSVGDFDGDGKAELAVKTAPGTKDGTGAYLSRDPLLVTTTALSTAMAPATS